MDRNEYLAEKPKDCQNCFFWKKRKRCCSLGEENCYFKVSSIHKPPSKCDGCPYGRDHPCIGWCTKKIMQELGIGKQREKEVVYMNGI